MQERIRLIERVLDLAGLERKNIEGPYLPAAEDGDHQLTPGERAEWSESAAD